MNIDVKTQDKAKLFGAIQTYLDTLQLKVVGMDINRPWGGFLVIEEHQARQFAAVFFPDEEWGSLHTGNKLSPKMLIVAPHKRLSWQYHHRRAEIWRVFKGTVGVATSDTDEQHEPLTYQEGDVIRLRQGQRHRLVGLDNWGVVAEIWQHTDPENPSDEDDIIRLQDDFGR